MKESSAKARKGRQTCVLQFGAHTVTFELNATDFKFEDFNNWVRSRLNINSSAGIAYKESSGIEILPSAALLKANDKIFVEEVISSDKKKGESGSSGSMSGGHSSNSSSKSKNSNVNRFFLDLSTVTFAVVVSIYAIAIAQPDSLSQCFKAASDFTQDAIIFYPIKPQVLSDAFIAFITWSLSYMFIRRLPNPENGCSVATLRKFSPDMLFGGLAASSAVLLKALVSAHIPRP